jgi:hypothetical protein
MGVTMSFPLQKFESVASTLVPAVLNDFININLCVCEIIIEVVLKYSYRKKRRSLKNYPLSGAGFTVTIPATGVAGFCYLHVPPPQPQAGFRRGHYPDPAYYHLSSKFLLLSPSGC